jgi:citrate lyase beta subunit
MGLTPSKNARAHPRLAGGLNAYSPPFDASATGVVQIDGVMLDAPHRARAHRIMTSFERG